MEESQKNAKFEEDKGRKEVKDDVTMIFGMMRDMFDYCDGATQALNLENLAKRVVAKGYSREALEETIKHYSLMDVIMRDNQGNILLVQ
jgi:hypothetical protein